MKLPEKNKEVSLPEIKEVCVAYGLTELWAKIEKDPPKKPFKSIKGSSLLLAFSI